MRFSKMTLAAGAVALALILGAACGDGGDEVAQPSPTPEPSPVIAEGSVAPRVFMTFEGKRYRARDAAPDLVSDDEVEVAGTTVEIDIDHAGPVKVYRLMHDSADSLFTFQPGRVMAEEEEGSVPDLWLEWVTETEGPAPGFSPEAGVATTTPVATPFISEPPVELPPSEREGATGPRYEVRVRFNTSVRQGDLDAVAALLEGYDQQLEFRIQQSFPPVARALLTTDVADFCSAVKAELEIKTHVHDVTCEQWREPSRGGDPEQPVSPSD